MLTLDLGGFNRGTLPYKTSIFPGGEIFFELDTIRAKETVDILTRLNSSDDIMRLIMAVDALRRAKFKVGDCTIPYIPYMQQDRVCAPGQSFSLKVMAKLLNRLKFQTIYTYDAHSNMSSALIKNLEDKGNRGFIQQVISTLSYKNVNVICPDQGASKKICPLLSSLGSYFRDSVIYICSKDRDPATNKLTKTTVPKIDNDLPCLIIDDLVLGGATFKNIVTEMRNNGNTNKVYLACTHGVLPDGAVEGLKPYFEKIFISNSRDDKYMIGSPNFDSFVHQLPLF